MSTPEGPLSLITTTHRAKLAYVYVRQSTADQLLHNHESRRRQYALTDRARALGWSEVVVVDDDLALGPQWPRLAHAIGVLRPGGLPIGR